MRQTSVEIYRLHGAYDVPLQVFHVVHSAHYRLQTHEHDICQWRQLHWTTNWIQTFFSHFVASIATQIWTKMKTKLMKQNQNHVNDRFYAEIVKNSKVATIRCKKTITSPDLLKSTQILIFLSLFESKWHFYPIDQCRLKNRNWIEYHINIAYLYVSGIRLFSK